MRVVYIKYTLRDVGCLIELLVRNMLTVMYPYTTFITNTIYAMP